MIRLPDSDADGQLIVEEDKPAAPSAPEMAAMLAERTETTRRDEAVQDEAYEEVVYDLIGTERYPLHALITGDGTVPRRPVVRQIQDPQGNAYEQPPES